MEEKCLICGGDKSIRNPSGGCDHLYYPDNLDINNALDKITSLHKKLNELTEINTFLRFNNKIMHKRVKEFEKESNQLAEGYAKLKINIRNLEESFKLTSKTKKVNSDE